MVRIIHTGDMHFDSPFAALPPAVARLRKEEQRSTFLRILDAVRDYKAEMLLIAGDMFDSRYVSPETIAFLREGFSQIPETKIFIAPGNHDFLASDSPYLTAELGKNVHVFKECMEAFEVGGAVVYGFGFSTRFIKESVLQSRIHKGDKAGILLMHGDVAAESDYNPVSASALAESGVTYAALGHIHAFSGFLHAGDTTYAYCGIPESRHFDEEGRGGFIRGEISNKEAKMEFIYVAKRQNITLEIDVTGLGSTEAVENKIRASLSPENLYKVVLCGSISNTMYIDTGLLQKELAEACLFVKVQDKTTLAEDIKEESILEKLFSERLSGRDDVIGKRALRFGIEALRRQKR